jgi:DNA-directed RNA polymerase subunit alpha
MLESIQDFYYKDPATFKMRCLVELEKFFGDFLPEGGIKPPANDPLDRIEKFKLTLASFEFTVRTANTLRLAGIFVLGDLVSKTARELRQYKNFGKKSLEEVEEFLKERGLRLGMEVPKNGPA